MPVTYVLTKQPDSILVCQASGVLLSHPVCSCCWAQRLRHAGDQPARGSQTQHRTLGKGNLKSGKNKNFLAKKMILSQIGSKALYRFLNQTTNLLGARVQISYFLIFYCLRLNNFFFYFFFLKFLNFWLFIFWVIFSPCTYRNIVEFPMINSSNFITSKLTSNVKLEVLTIQVISNLLEIFFFHKSCCDHNTMFYVYQSIERKLLHVRRTHEADFVPIPLKISDYTTIISKTSSTFKIFTFLKQLVSHNTLQVLNDKSSAIFFSFSSNPAQTK